MEMMFQLFDLDGKGGITKDELRTVLLSIVTPPNQVMREGGGVPSFGHRSSNLIPMGGGKSGIIPQSPNLGSSKANSPKMESQQAASDPDEQPQPQAATDTVAKLSANGSNSKPPLHLSASGASVEAFAQQTNSVLSLGGYQDVNEEPINIEDIQSKVNEIVDKAFKECDTDESGRLDPAQFKEFIRKNPEIIEVCEELFIQLAWNGPQKDTVRQDCM